VCQQQHLSFHIVNKEWEGSKKLLYALLIAHRLPQVLNRAGTGQAGI
jgi:hypothetical protein